MPQTLCVFTKETNLVIGILVVLMDFFDSPVTSTVLKTLDNGLNISSLFSILKSKFSKSDLEYQMISLLDESLEMACNELGWEYDSMAMSQEFDIKCINNTIMTKDSLSQLLSSLTGMTIDNNAADIFINCFDKAIARNDELSRYLVQKWLRYVGKEKSLGLSERDRFIQTSITTIPAEVNLLGRENEIAKIKEQISSHKIISINADGGVGKTAVAIKIANDFKNEINNGASQYKHIAWITSSGDLKKDLSELNIPRIKEQNTIDDKLWVALAFLQSTPVLIVIDNMDRLPTMEEKSILNTIAGQTNVMITSRVEIRDFYIYSLPEIDNTSAERLFYICYLDQDIPLDDIQKREDYETSQLIIKYSSNNALLIELIGKLAFAENKKLCELVLLLENSLFIINSDVSLYTSHAESHGMNPDVDGTLTMQEQIGKLYEMSNLSLDQMEILSFFTLFPVGSKVFPMVLEWCEFSSNDMQWLLRRGWIKKENENYLMHPIVISSIELQNEKRAYKVDLNKYHNLILGLVNTNQYLSDNLEYSKYKERAAIPKCICSILENEIDLDFSTSEILFYLILSVSELLCKREGDYLNAILGLSKALSLSIRLYGEVSEQTAGIYNRIAGLYFDIFDYENALLFIKKDYLISVTIGKHDFGMAHTYNLLGEVYGKLGKYIVSKYYFLKALSVLSIVQLAPDEYQMCEITRANIYDNVANMYNDRKKHEKALRYHLEALAIYESILDEESSEIAISYNNIALTYYCLGKLNEAQYYYEKSLNIRKKVLGDNHPFLLGTYLGLRDVYFAQGNKEGVRMIEREIQEKY